jgi:hypothetical protein
MRQRNADQSFAVGDGKAIFANVNSGQGTWFSIPAPVTMNDPGNPNQQPGYSNPLLGSTDGKAVFHIATDFGTDRTLHAYYAWRPVAPSGSSATEGAQALVASGSSQFFARSSAGSLERWLPGGPGAPFGTGSASNTTLAGEPAAFVFQTQEHVFARSSAGDLAHWYVDTSTDAGATDTWGTGIAGDPAVLVVGDAQHAWATDGTGSLQH